MSDMLKKADFRDFVLLRDWVTTLRELYGDHFVRGVYNYDTEHLEGGEDIRNVRGLRSAIERMVRHYQDGGNFYPYERLYGKRADEIGEDIDRWLSAKGSKLNSQSDKGSFLDMLGKEIDTCQDDKVRQKYIDMFGQAMGFLQSPSINIDASQKNIIADTERKKVAAEEIVDRVRKKSIEYKAETDSELVEIKEER